MRKCDQRKDRVEWADGVTALFHVDEDEDKEDRGNDNAAMRDQEAEGDEEISSQQT